MNGKFTLLFFVLIIYSSSGQVYKPMLGNINEWHFTTCFTGCITDVYYTDGDTLVNGKIHKILDGYHYVSRTFLIREDDAQRKIYLTKIQPNRIEEYLLYDFSLNEGDIMELTNPYTPFPMDAGEFVLDSIRSHTLSNSQSYRHFYLSPTSSNTISSDPAIWIEGVGSLSMLTAPSGYPDENGVGHLSCFFKNSENIYSNPDYNGNCEPLHLGNNITGVVEEAFLYTPSNSNISILENAWKFTALEVYDLSGRLIAQQKAHNKQTLTIDLNGKKSGIYLIKALGPDSYLKVFKAIKK